ncbi:DgyrCDS6079 [Dimorphilus gyrociliatus]|uniref:DgyrCDS6079 n=1 Tax=Dimorphilus gyrociliatus TaxID=2664684 RepID=A0A7I8VNJ9_9ANNE|nr:DgyrCDS6079 [Dimorphilus gyrociliatus]
MSQDFSRHAHRTAICRRTTGLNQSTQYSNIQESLEGATDDSGLDADFDFDGMKKNVSFPVEQINGYLVNGHRSLERKDIPIRLNNGRITSPANTEASDMSIDALSREFFPITLGAAYDVKRAIESSKLTTSYASPPTRKRRPGSAQSSSSSTSKASSLDRMHLLTVDAQYTTGATAALMSSPYQAQLAELRMQRLRMEEAQLLQVKRQEELERMRGPLIRWYELKTPQFHYESRKNRELIQSKNDWQQLLEHRASLERSSSTSSTPT